MALNIKDPETDRLARAVASATGASITQAVNVALQEKLDRLRPVSRDSTLEDDLARIAARAAARPTLDARSAEELIGYDADGLPT